MSHAKLPAFSNYSKISSYIGRHPLSCKIGIGMQSMQRNCLYRHTSHEFNQSLVTLLPQVGKQPAGRKLKAFQNTVCNPLAGSSRHFKILSATRWQEAQGISKYCLQPAGRKLKAFQNTVCNPLAGSSRHFKILSATRWQEAQGISKYCLQPAGRKLKAFQNTVYCSTKCHSTLSHTSLVS